jgi:hypothetical protein
VRQSWPVLSRKFVTACFLGLFLLFSHVDLVGRDSSVSITTGYRLEGLGIESRWGRGFSHMFRLAL